MFFSEYLTAIPGSIAPLEHRPSGRPFHEHGTKNQKLSQAQKSNQLLKYRRKKVMEHCDIWANDVILAYATKIWQLQYVLATKKDHERNENFLMVKLINFQKRYQRLYQKDVKFFVGVT